MIGQPPISSVPAPYSRHNVVLVEALAPRSTDRAILGIRHEERVMVLNSGRFPRRQALDNTV